jgi:hypothetical protein
MPGGGDLRAHPGLEVVATEVLLQGRSEHTGLRVAHFPRHFDLHLAPV